MSLKPDNQLFVGYLFGELSELEQDRIEELYFMDDNVYEQLSAVENDLIDRYVQNRLTESERKDFEEKYLITPARHRKVAESERLINLIINSPSDSPKPSWWKSLLAFLGHRGMLLQYSLAAAFVVLVLGCVWLIRERARLGNQVAQTYVSLQQKEVELQRQDAGYRRASEKLQEELRGEQAQRERDRQMLRQLQELVQQYEEIHQREKSRPATGSSFVATYVFPLVTVRGGNSQKQLVIRRGERSVRLVIYLKNNSYKKYHVSVQRVSGEEVWSDDLSKGPGTSVGERLSFNLPASVFMKKDYILAVNGVKPDGTIENLDTRSFSVINQNVRQE